MTTGSLENRPRRWTPTLGRPPRRWRSIAAIFAVIAWLNATPLVRADAPMPAPPAWLSPSALVAAPDGKRLFVACRAVDRILQVDPVTGKVVREFPVSAGPTGLAISPDGATLYATCGGPEGRVEVIGLVKDDRATIPAGHTAVSPLLSADGKTLYVCQRFEDRIVAFDLTTRAEAFRVAVPREPIHAALGAGGKTLLVAHHLHDGRADAPVVSANVTVVDLAARKVSATLALPNGSDLLREVRVAPDGTLACVTHNLARFQLPTTQVDRGWMNTSALTLIDLKGPAPRLINTVLLDDVDRGAANPWGVAWSADGKTLCVAHAGTHEVSLIDVPALLAKLAKLPESAGSGRPYAPESASRVAADVPNDLSFLVGLRRRIRATGKGTRTLALVGSTLYAANYFSDTVDRFDLKAPVVSAPPIRLGPEPQLTPERRGEIAFNDATNCFQGWQSCATCHSDDARVDALNWDLLNDGIGNPKNVKSMLLAHRTPPAMSSGVRETAETAVRAGIRHALFTQHPEGLARDVDSYLKSLRPVPGPEVTGGKPSPAAQRGSVLFHSQEVGCAGCHGGPLLTDMKHHDTGTRNGYDRPGESFDTPTLVEIWRTAPYLHDGSAATLRDVLTTRNPDDQHGQTSQLSPAQLDDLVAYLRSL